MVHHLNAEGGGLLWILELYFFAFEVNGPTIERLNSRQPFNECRFSRTVIANKGCDRAGLNREINSAQYIDGTETLGDSLDFEDGL